MSNSAHSDTTDGSKSSNSRPNSKRGSRSGPRSSSRNRNASSNEQIFLDLADTRSNKTGGTQTPNQTHPHVQPHQNNNMMRSFILKAVEKKNIDPVIPPITSKIPPPLAEKPAIQIISEPSHKNGSSSTRTVHSSSIFAGRSSRPEPILTDDPTEMALNDTTKSSINQSILSPKPASPTTLSRPARASSAYSNSITALRPTTLISTGSVDVGSLALHTIPSSPTFIKSKEIPGTDFEQPTVGRDAFFANGPLNAIAASPNQEQVAVAGREDISPDEIEESLNLRVAYRQNLNFSSADVDWGVGYCRDRLATATTSGSVVVWDLNKTGHKIERLITEHTRAVHRVKFHPSTGTTLFSASQDGTIKAWDVRTKDPARMTFYPKAEAVRDFRFNPLHPEEFVAAFDNGSIQMWDIRQPGQYIKKLTAHSGPTLAVDWHHDGRTVASGGRDKLIKIWDMKSDSRKPTGLIQTIAPVAAVRWRPHHGYQIASTSLSTDYAINVWDTHRPFIPRFSVIGHSNVTTDIFWAGQDVLWSSSKDQHFLRRRLDRGEKQGAKEPILYLPTSGISWNSYGDLGFVVDRPGQSSTLPPRPSPSIDSRAERRRALASRLNLSSSFDKNFRISPTQTGGILHLPAFDYSSFAFLALNYSIDCQDPLVATETNFRVAHEAGHFRTAQTWKILQLICCKFASLKEASKDNTKPISKSNAKEHPGLDIPAPIVHPMITKTTAEPSISQYPTSGSSIHSYPRPLQIDADEPLELDEWLEGIQIYDAASDSSDDPRPPRRLSSSTTPGRKIEQSVDPSTRLSVSSLSLSDSSDSSSTQSSVHSSPILTGQFPHDWDSSQLVQDLLVYYADEGDVQMCSTIVLVLGERLQIPKQKCECWVYSYIELLRRFKLWEPATAILNVCQLPELTSQNQESTTFYTICPHCRRPLLASSESSVEGYWGCNRCQKLVDPCGICHQLVKGVYSWCQGCGHGGHLACFQAWFNSSGNNLTLPPCPTGCGHNCSIILS